MNKKRAAFAFAPIDDAIIYAIKNLARGEANEGQQKRALAWIVNMAAMTHDCPYYETDRDTCFATGRQWVGRQIIDLVNRKMEPGEGREPKDNTGDIEGDISE